MVFITLVMHDNLNLIKWLVTAYKPNMKLRSLEHEYSGLMLALIWDYSELT
jgi:hypothetical protein